MRWQWRGRLESSVRENGKDMVTDWMREKEDSKITLSFVSQMSGMVPLAKVIARMDLGESVCPHLCYFQDISKSLYSK